MYNHMSVVPGNSNPELSKGIEQWLGASRICEVDLGIFPDGETSVKPKRNIRGSDVFVLQSTGPVVNDNLMEMLILIDACRRASAERITAVIPYFGYARQDRKDSGRVPITAKLVANLIQTAGADRVLTVDLHSPQIQAFFDIPTDHLKAYPELVKHLKSLMQEGEKYVVVSPDMGSVKRCHEYVKGLGAGISIINKERLDSRTTVSDFIIGASLEGSICILIDDMITTGGSILGAAKAVRNEGAKEVWLVATHPVLCGNALDRIASSKVDRLIVTDTLSVTPKILTLKESFKELSLKIDVITMSSILAEAISRIHRNISVSDLLKESLQ